MEVTILPKHSK